MPEIKKTEVVYQTSWFCLHEKTVELPESNEHKRFYSIHEGNHVTIVAEDDEKRILLVKQYRPALEDFVTELPGGHVRDNDPVQSARKELLEETGFVADQLQFLGRIIVDSGRNEGYLNCFFAKDLKQVGGCEDGIELVQVTRRELQEMILNGEFTHSLNMSAIFLATLRGLLTLD